ncbi:conserved hypothetical protein [Roseibium sp. TrichSKD4]|uniref:hypothetical protein n=1 Tax=Roseibium sp. TrichSKD4 TaxID=744980 RepID=UPI0001E56CD6|nr:hypothetical protein [Roseibium sp. TrichSKD4]EFO32129.1 conserved hypothetical protein [Roseibium sp. TrichSKD4]
MPKFTVKSDTWIENQLRKKGDSVEMTEKAAKYYLQMGQIVPADKTQAEKKPAETGAKKTPKGGKTAT